MPWVISSMKGMVILILEISPSKLKGICVLEKFIVDKTDVNMSKTQMPFIFEGEIAKIKITMPLTKLITQGTYKSQVLKVLNMGNDADTFHMANDTPELFFGPKIEGKYQ